MTSLTVPHALPDRWSVLARSTDVRCMAVIIVLSMVVLFYFIATLHAVVARGPWRPSPQEVAAQPAAQPLKPSFGPIDRATLSATQ